MGKLHLPVNSSFQCPHIYEIKGNEFMIEEFTTRPKIITRNLLVATTIYSHSLEKDEFHKDMMKLTLFFFYQRVAMLQ